MQLLDIYQKWWCRVASSARANKFVLEEKKKKN